MCIPHAYGLDRPEFSDRWLTATDMLNTFQGNYYLGDYDQTIPTVAATMPQPTTEPSTTTTDCPSTRPTPIPRPYGLRPLRHQATPWTQSSQHNPPPEPLPPFFYVYQPHLREEASTARSPNHAGATATAVASTTVASASKMRRPSACINLPYHRNRGDCNLDRHLQRPWSLRPTRADAFLGLLQEYTTCDEPHLCWTARNHVVMNDADSLSIK